MGNTVTLHSACAYGDLRSVRALLRRATAAELEAADDSGRTPLLVAVAAMAFKADGDSDDEDAADAAFFGDDASLSGESDDDDENGGSGGGGGDDTAAVGDGDKDQDKDAGESKRNDDDGSESEPEDVEEYTESASIEPLSKYAEILHLLLQKHVNLDHQDENGWTALHHACFGQNAVAIKMLVHAGAQPMRDKFGLLPQVCERESGSGGGDAAGALTEHMVHRTSCCADSRRSGSRRRRTSRRRSTTSQRRRRTRSSCSRSGRAASCSWTWADRSRRARWSLVRRCVELWSCG